MDHLDLTVSVIIPAHNELQAVADVVAACKRHTPNLLEVIVVDDGSTDGTAAAAESAGARVIRMEVNGGKGLAMQRGIRDAVGDILVFIDADGQDDPSEIPQLLAAFHEGVDLVLGSRFLGEFRPGAITRLNYMGTKLITGTLNVLFGVHLTDPLAGFRGVRRTVFDRIQLEARGYDVEVDLVIRVLGYGGRVVEVPASRSARSFGASGLSSVRDGTKIMSHIIRLRLRGGRPANALVEEEAAA